MTRGKLEQEFTSMLAHTDTARAYGNLTNSYLNYDDNYKLLSDIERKEKLKELREGDPKEWITKIFTNGLKITPLLYKVNILWLKHLEGVAWE